VGYFILSHPVEGKSAGILRAIQKLIKSA